MHLQRFYLSSILFFITICIFGTCAFSALQSLQKRSATTKGTTASPAKSQMVKKCDECPKGIRCVPPIQCPALMQMKQSQRPQLCDLPGGTHGYCCTSGYKHTVNKIKSHKSSARSAATTTDSSRGNQKYLRAVIDEAKSEFNADINKEKSLKQQSIGSSQPTFFHNLVFRSSHNSLLQSIDLSHRALEKVYASRIYKKRENIPTEDFELDQVDAFLEGTTLEDACNQPATCEVSPSKYRTPDGKCNNLGAERNQWGAAGAPMERLLPPSYDDGIWAARLTSVDGSPLTNPRTISRTLLHDVDRPHSLYNLLFMQFGQFLTHDVTQSASITTADGKSVSCCTEDGSSRLDEQQLHYACMPIDIEPDDEFFSHYNQGCMNFVRSSLSIDNECKLGYGKQLSKATHYIDASIVYGSDKKTQNEVRSFRRGMLRMTDDFGRDILPMAHNKESCGAEKLPCFFTGDGRSNQIITLTALHLLFAREHNTIANVLADLNPHWSDDKLFHETRAIVIAQLQHIIYTEWLPLLIGSDTMERFGLNVRGRGYSDDYSEEINGCITSEFSTAAFRFGHSVVDGKLIVHHGQKVDEIINIPDVMFDSSRLRRRSFFDEILNTLTHQPLQQVDAAVTSGLSKFLFRGDNPFGLDLAAINIYRGRDHGIRPYNDYLEASGHARISDFSEFGEEIGEKLASVYAHPDDIDLWVGGLIESAKGDALVGPTFSEIIADQFSRFRRGDRYFYEHNPEINPGFLTLEQLAEIRKTSMARLICDNADGDALRAQAPLAFIRPDVQGNAPVPCSDIETIPSLDFSPWREAREL